MLQALTTNLSFYSKLLLTAFTDIFVIISRDYVP